LSVRWESGPMFGIAVSVLEYVAFISVVSWMIYVPLVCPDCPRIRVNRDCGMDVQDIWVFMFVIEFEEHVTFCFQNDIIQIRELSRKYVIFSDHIFFYLKLPNDKSSVWSIATTVYTVSIG
jgi:hypothetical protein